MQNSDTGSKVDSASLIDLKAELYRKQEEFKTQKLQNQNTGFIRGKPSTSNKKPSLFSKKNVGVSQRAEKDYEEKQEEENVFERSRKALENKAKLYEKIASGTDISEEDGSGLYLVDFQRKNLDDFEERREKERKDKEEMERRELEEEQRQLAEPVLPPESEEDEWVDYVDAFGRSRRCLRKDLHDVQRQDETLQIKKRKIDEKVHKGMKDFQELRDKNDAVPGLMSADMRREMDRQKWETEEIEKMEEEKQGPIHYADVQHNEIRTHGVGFFKFDKDESVRQEQMEQLHKLRQETKDERSKSERIKEKRKAALAARLAKVKQRKREKLGLPETQEDENGSSGEEIGPKLSEEVKKEPEPLTRDDSWRTTVQSTRDWDKGKHVTMERSEQMWLEKQRAEREEEFAPPSFYYDAPPSKNNSERGKANIQIKPKSEKFHERTEVQTVIEKQLNELRKNTELKTPQMVKSEKIDQEDCDIKPLSELITPIATASIPNFPPPIHYNAPPPNFQSSSVNFSVPPPNLNYLSENLNIPPPNLNIPPPNMNIPPPNMNIPPPNYNQAEVNPVTVPGFTNVSNSSSVAGGGFTVPSFQAAATETFLSSQTEGSAAKQTGEKLRKKYVPKLDIIDTRLMGSEND